MTTGLATEKDRWAQTVREMRLGSVTIAGDVMLAAAFTCYIGKWEEGRNEIKAGRRSVLFRCNIHIADATPLYQC